MVQRYLRGLYGDWAIILKENGKMIGTVGYAMIDTHAEHCEIGYVLSPYFRKKGYMTEAVNAVLDLTFRDFGFRTAELRIMDENADSVKLAERVGFELGRTVPDEIEVKGLPRTLRHYYMTDKRYREIRGI